MNKDPEINKTRKRYVYLDKFETYKVQVEETNTFLKKLIFYSFLCNLLCLALSACICYSMHNFN